MMKEGLYLLRARRSLEAMGCNLGVSSSHCDRMVPMPTSVASTSTSKGLEGSGCLRIGSVVKACLRRAKGSSRVEFHTCFLEIGVLSFPGGSCLFQSLAREQCYEFSHAFHVRRVRVVSKEYCRSKSVQCVRSPLYFSGRERLV